MASGLLRSSFTITSVPPGPKPFFLPPTRRPLFLRSSPRHIAPISCSSSPDSPTTSGLEPQGTGTAAPTRGELLIERHQAKIAASIVLKKGQKKMKNRTKKAKTLSTEIACCYGCGAPLHTDEVDAPGYVDLATFEVKKKHRQLRTVLCGRCKLLSHGHMVTAVGGHGGYHGGKQFVSAEQLREKLAHLRNEKALIVKLVDIVDFNGSFLAHIRDLAGANPIILVVTKIDLLPKGTDLNCVGDWVVEASLKKKLNVISAHLTSSKSLVGITGVISEIQKERKGRDVYILGAANVGKSAFINSMLKMMAGRDLVAAAAWKYKPIQSAVPGTTLGPIQIDTLLAGNASDKKLCDINGNLNGSSIFWGGLFRIDIEKVLPQTRLTFYGPRALQIHAVPTFEADEFYHRELGILLTPPTGKERAEIWPGLETVRDLKIKFDDKRRPACDIAISGLGWISVEPFGNASEATEIGNREDAFDELHLKIHIPKPVEIFIRPPLPVGQSGGELYEYRELTEREEELRPKWYF